MSLSDKFPTRPVSDAGSADANAIVLTTEDLETLDERFEALREEVKSGKYVVEAKQEGEEQFLGTTSSRIDRSYNGTTLTVTIKPSDRNPDASIKEMAFTFKHDVRKETGCWSTSKTGYIENSFRIEMADGNVFTYGPEKGSAYGGVSELLSEAKGFGLDKIYAEKNAVKLAEQQQKQKAKDATAAAKAAALRNIRM